jgi:hypothetical protein
MESFHGSTATNSPKFQTAYAPDLLIFVLFKVFSENITVPGTEAEFLL